ncbi:XisI protein [Moorena producens]|uniref:XisI protein n=1 Tax=Moorena producens TaxID=1155739 RepID=UPI000A4B2E3B|nr:XisI protein [Moorena producens]
MPKREGNRNLNREVWESPTKRGSLVAGGCQYLLLHTGWKDNRRTHGCSLHLDIKNGKIWIQHDGTEIGIATQLLELGVPAEDIVLGFHSPNMRQYTEFAVD